MSFGVSPVAGLLDRLQERLLQLKSHIEHYQQQPSELSYIDIVDLLKKLEEQENLDVMLPESVTINNRDSIQQYVSESTAALTSEQETLGFKQLNFKRTANIIEKNLKKQSSQP